MSNIPDHAVNMLDLAMYRSNLVRRRSYLLEMTQDIRTNESAKVLKEELEEIHKDLREVNDILYAVEYSK